MVYGEVKIEKEYSIKMLILFMILGMGILAKHKKNEDFALKSNREKNNNTITISSVEYTNVSHIK